MNLKHLTDKSLLNDTKKLASEYRAVTTKLLHHMREIDQRKLFSDLGYNSLYDYAVRELGFSEASANRRVHACRMLKEFPELESKIESGELNLSNLTKASQLFKNENITNTDLKKDILTSIENKSARECDKELSKTAPPITKPKRELQTLTPELTMLKVILTDCNVKKYDELKGLLAHRKLTQDQIFGIIFDKAKEKLVQEQFKVGKKSKTKDPRYVIAKTKHDIYQNAHGKCQKCGSHFFLQIDHNIPFALGGVSSEVNLRLLCHNCNQRERIRKIR